MPKKKKLNKTERREIRLRKARQWALTYEGSHTSVPTGSGSRWTTPVR